MAELGREASEAISEYITDRLQLDYEKKSDTSTDTMVKNCHVKVAKSYARMLNALEAFSSARNNKGNTIPEEAGQAQIEMPRYRSHKEIHALKIARVAFGSENNSWSLIMEPENSRYQNIIIKGDTAHRIRKAMHDHQINTADDDVGYYVVYEDGYVSWSPTEAFEKGYFCMSDGLGAP